MMLWTREEAAEATGGAARGDWPGFEDLQIDSRLAKPGDFFVALTAARDGHDFARAAFDAGASAALVSRVPEGLEDAPLLLVDDVQAALEALGRARRAALGARVIAVTGSVGKTSTKDMLHRALAPQARVHAAVASFNNHWGVPITLARAPKDAEALVIEIGMNAPGEIAPLSRQAAPHVTLVTAIAPAHIGAFGTLDAIAEEKASIVQGLRRGGTAVMPADQPTAGILAGAARAQGVRLTTFGRLGGWRVEGIQSGPGAVALEAETPVGHIGLRLGVPGTHFASNALGALAAVDAAGFDARVAASALAGWTPTEGRGTRERVEVPGGAVDLWDDAFNANPASLEAALGVLAAQSPRGRRVAILGDMLELGEGEAAMHAALADLPAMGAVGAVHTVGPLMAHLAAALPEARRGRHFDDAAAAAAAAGDLVAPGDAVLVKGSKGSHVARVVPAIRALGGR